MGSGAIFISRQAIRRHETPTPPMHEPRQDKQAARKGTHGHETPHRSDSRRHPARYRDGEASKDDGHGTNETTRSEERTTTRNGTPSNKPPETIGSNGTAARPVLRQERQGEGRSGGKTDTKPHETEMSEVSRATTEAEERRDTAGRGTRQAEREDDGKPMPTERSKQTAPMG